MIEFKPEKEQKELSHPKMAFFCPCDHHHPKVHTLVLLPSGETALVCTECTAILVINGNDSLLELGVRFYHDFINPGEES